MEFKHGVCTCGRIVFGQGACGACGGIQGRVMSQIYTMATHKLLFLPSPVCVLAIVTFVAMGAIWFGRGPPCGGFGSQKISLPLPPRPG